MSSYICIFNKSPLYNFFKEKLIERKNTFVAYKRISVFNIYALSVAHG